MSWHVIAFEGFSGHPTDRLRFSASFVKHHWLPLLADIFPDGQVCYCSQREQAICAAVQGALAVCHQRSDTALAVLGFSNGGHAAIQFVQRLAESGIRIQLGFTADPIPKGWGYVARKAELLRRPANAERWVNVYQRSDLCSLGFLIPLKGYPVIGADENTQLHGLGPRGHVRLPSDERVLAKLFHEFKAAGAGPGPSQEIEAAAGG